MNIKDFYARWHQGPLESLPVLLQTSNELDPQLASDLIARADDLAKRLRQAFDLPAPVNQNPLEPADSTVQDLQTPEHSAMSRESLLFRDQQRRLQETIALARSIAEPPSQSQSGLDARP